MAAERLAKLILGNLTLQLAEGIVHDALAPVSISSGIAVLLGRHVAVLVAVNFIDEGFGPGVAGRRRCGLLPLIGGGLRACVRLLLRSGVRRAADQCEVVEIDIVSH